MSHPYNYCKNSVHSVIEKTDSSILSTDAINYSIVIVDTATIEVCS